jgi:hypothetical protein
MSRDIYKINQSTIDIKNRIIDSVKNGKQLSIVRMGDGEMIIANNIENKVKNFCIQQIGRALTNEELVITQNNMKNSIIYSNIVGLPTQKHIEKNVLWSNIIDFYDKIFTESPDLNHKTKEFCSIDIHLDLLKSGLLFDIFESVSDVVIVSPRDISQKLKSKYPNITNLEYYSLPGEQVFETEKNKDVNVINRIDEIKNHLISKDRKNQLLIYGCGAFGKHLGFEFSKLGGVSLDLGSVFDFLVGKITRGTGKGPNSYTKPYL